MSSDWREIKGYSGILFIMTVVVISGGCAQKDAKGLRERANTFGEMLMTVSAVEDSEAGGILEIKKLIVPSHYDMEKASEIYNDLKSVLSQSRLTSFSVDNVMVRRGATVGTVQSTFVWAAHDGGVKVSSGYSKWEKVNGMWYFAGLKTSPDD